MTDFDFTIRPDKKPTTNTSQPSGGFVVTSTASGTVSRSTYPGGDKNTHALTRISSWLLNMGWGGILGVVFCSVPTFIFAAGAMTGSVEWSKVCINLMMPWLNGLNTCIFLTLFGFTCSHLIILFIRGVKAMEDTASLMKTLTDSARTRRP